MTVPDPSTIIAICTPRGSGGVGLVRLSGPQALPIGRVLFRSRPVLGHRVRHVTYGRVVDGEGRPVDAALAWYLEGPATYTGEDVVEISTHGSDAVLDLVVDRGKQLGAHLAQPGEFTRRAFLHGRIDLLQAEAVADLIQAQSAGSLQAAYGILGGELSDRVRLLREDLVDVLARLETLLDFSDDVDAAEIGNLDATMERVEQGAAGLVGSFAGARARLRGFTVVLAGRPNAGKSTLFNALLGEERSIVTHVPGTTRDWVEGHANWSGESVRLVDTAGLRDSADAVEQAGVERTRQQMKAADLVLLIVDGSDRASTDPIDSQGLDRATQITVISKADLPQARPAEFEGEEAIVVSARTGDGLQALREAILRRLPTKRGKGEAAPLRERHRDALAATAEATRRARRLLAENAPEVAAMELQAGLRSVGELLGERVDEAVLDRIFSEFCIGK
jgi:tRNA modification GTPase